MKRQGQKRQGHQSTLVGTAQIFLAEVLLLPTGLITAAFLSRRLGPEGYGLFTLAATLISWIEWSIASVFARATIKLVGEAEDWKPVGATVVRLHLLVSVLCALLLWLGAAPLARAFNEPSLARCFAWFAWDIPLFCLAQAHRNILVGLGEFRQRALATGGRWVFRLVLIILLVQCGLSVLGAILGSLGASLVELAICRWYVRPAWTGQSEFSAKKLYDYALPLFLFAMTMRIYDKTDLFLLKMLGGSTAQSGLYGAAQNLAIIPGIFALSFAPVLLANLSRMVRAGETAQIAKMGRDALRLMLVLFPLAGLMAGAAPEIIAWLYGPHFLAAAAWLSWLIFGSVALATVSTQTAILTATGKPGWTFALAGPLLPLVVVCDLLVIPHFGALGAAAMTTGVAALGALVMTVAVGRLERVPFPYATLGRSLILTVVVAASAASWHTHGAMLLGKFSVLLAAILLGFFLLGELKDIPVSLQEKVSRLRGLYTRPKAA